MEQIKLPQSSAQLQLGEAAQKHDLRKPYTKPELTEYASISSATMIVRRS